jgi:hypothetical protein
VTVLGGSISTGAVASRKQASTDPNDLWSLVRIYMQKNLDDSITFSNNARSATRSYITSLCLEKFLDDTSDLVFVEFIANDGSEMDLSYVDNQKARFFERFLRNIMRKPKAPAVVMMQVRSSGTTAYGSCDNGRRTGAWCFAHIDGADGRISSKSKCVQGLTRLVGCSIVLWGGEAGRSSRGPLLSAAAAASAQQHQHK